MDRCTLGRISNNLLHKRLINAEVGPGAQDSRLSESYDLAASTLNRTNRHQQIARLLPLI